MNATVESKIQKLMAKLEETQVLLSQAILTCEELQREIKGDKAQVS